MSLSRVVKPSSEDKSASQRFVADQIRKAREAQGLSQDKLRQALKKSSVSTISKWENGERSPSLRDIWNLARVLEKPVAFFVDPHYEERERQHTAELKQSGIGALVGREVLVEVKLHEHHGLNDEAFTRRGAIGGARDGLLLIGDEALALDCIQTIHFVD